MSHFRLALISAMKMFSATDTSGQSAISWWTKPMPSSWARAGEVISTGSPLSRISPLSGCRMPSMMFISVDLPAPFSPAMRMHLAAPQLEVDPAQRLDRAERLADVARF